MTHKGLYSGTLIGPDMMQTLHLTRSQTIDLFVNDPMYQCTDAKTAERHFDLVYAQKLGYGGILDGGNDKVNCSETLGSKSGGQASRQYALTTAASKVYSQTKKIEAPGSSKSSPKRSTNQRYEEATGCSHPRP